MERISIALCTFNGESFLRDQLDSYLEQTRLPDELVVCDDGSTDATLSILREFGRRSPFPVNIHENEINLGFAKNFEKAISLCTGALIFLSDQDDVWMPGKIKAISKRFSHDPQLGMVFTDAELVDEKLRKLGIRLFGVPYNAQVRDTVQRGRLLETLLFRNHITGATMAFKRQLIEYVMPLPGDEVPEMNHDGWIGFVSTVLGKYEFLDIPLINYRQHARQLIGVYEVKPKKESDEPEPQWGFEEASKYVRSDIKRISALLEYFQKHKKLSVHSAAIRKVAEPIIHELNRKLTHYQGRNNLPPSLFPRTKYVLKEMVSGNYHLFSNGAKSIAKDLLYL